MINLANRTITFDGKPHAILKFEVWFQSVVGLHTTLDDALNEMRKLDELDTTQSLTRLIRPVPVAVAAEIYEVIP